jgi:hypothetical protein
MTDQLPSLNLQKIATSPGVVMLPVTELHVSQGASVSRTLLGLVRVIFCSTTFN